MPAINLSHVVHHLSFGRALTLPEFQSLPKEVAAAWNPLHGTAFVARTQNVTIEHYLKYTINSHQYEDHSAYPALVFSYELAPVEVIVRLEQESFASFLTQICAIVGGVFTVTGLVDSLVYHGDRIVRRKMEIGKSI
ncbi:endoplasmic reticulum vesicle transporter [Pavlovales sp. CCMP2436]|nr:endoplasmic reticulum vesicle transporter [Pavlovales sp. CCMP2436]